jgi:carboxypeptidase C (cathepsin A)
MSKAMWVIVGLAGLLAAGQATSGEEDVPGEPVTEIEQTAVTRHSIRIGDETVNYRAAAGTLHLPGEDEQPDASVFYISYTREGIGNLDRRPVMFTFNGGPGSSSVWLHMGTFGPRRVAMADGQQPDAAPYTLEDNAYSLLDVTDLVFIDPVGTGYSHALGDAENKDFHGVDQDVQAVGDFIRLWVTRNQRWNSPKLVGGESYGTTRTAALASHLQRRGMFVNGLVLVSSILNFQTARFDTGNDLPYIMFLPTYAATAWYHRQLPGQPESLEPFLDEVRRFAAGEYATALMQGDRLGEAGQARIAERLAAYTGLDPEYLLQTNLRINIFRFTKELLRDERRTVGRLDSRFKGMDRDAAGERFEHDPSMTAIMGPYTAALNHYVRTELEFHDDAEYEILSGEVNRNWDWMREGSRGVGYVNVAEDLRRSLARDPNLHVFVANGYYDLATPFFATEYTMDHLHVEPEVKANIDMQYYEAGHMMYVHPESLVKLKQDLATFIDGLKR